FVYVKEGFHGRKFAPQTEPVILQLIGCEFQPYILGVQIGQTLLVTNTASVLHNFHFTSQAGNREINKALTSQIRAISMSFSKPEIFGRVKCDVHPWEFAYIGVSEHPFFAV